MWLPWVPGQPFQDHKERSEVPWQLPWAVSSVALVQLPNSVFSKEFLGVWVGKMIFSMERVIPSPCVSERAEKTDTVH